MPMYGLVGRIRALPGKRSELAAILVPEEAGMPGCFSYIVAEDPADDDVLIVTEVWTDSAAHKASLTLDSARRPLPRAAR